MDETGNIVTRTQDGKGQRTANSLEEWNYSYEEGEIEIMAWILTDIG